MKPLKRGDVVVTPYGLGVIESENKFYNLTTGEECWEVATGFALDVHRQKRFIKQNVAIKDITVPKMLDVLWNQDEY